MYRDEADHHRFILFLGEGVSNFDILKAVLNFDEKSRASRHADKRNFLCVLSKLFVSWTVWHSRTQFWWSQLKANKKRKKMQTPTLNYIVLNCSQTKRLHRIGIFGCQTIQETERFDNVRGNVQSLAAVRAAFLKAWASAALLARRQSTKHIKKRSASIAQFKKLDFSANTNFVQAISGFLCQKWWKIARIWVCLNIFGIFFMLNCEIFKINSIFAWEWSRNVCI